ncbi:MAG: hypothetical protein ACK4SY_09080 [Pyrobaculum sp.]
MERDTINALTRRGPTQAASRERLERRVKEGWDLVYDKVPHDVAFCEGLVMESKKGRLSCL